MLDRAEHIAGHALDIQRLLIGHIRNTEAAAQIELFQRHAQLGVNLAVQPHDALRGKFEALRIKDLGSHVAVQAAQVQVVRLQATLGRSKGRARGERNAELLVLMRRGDEFVRMRINTRLDADHHRLDLAGLARNAIEFFQLELVVNDHVTHAGVYAQTQVFIVLIVAVRGDALGRKLCGQGNLELIERGRVQAQAFLIDPVHDLL